MAEKKKVVEVAVEPEPEAADAQVEAAPETDEGPELLEIVVREAPMRVYKDARDDFELLDEIMQVEGGDIMRLTVLMRRLMPDADRAAAMDLARGDNGRVSLAAAMDLVGDILVGMNNPN